jgi:hypothetical protein
MVKRVILALITLVTIALAGIGAAAQQEVAPDHFDGGDYRVQPRRQSPRGASFSSRSRKARLRRGLGTQSGAYGTSKRKLRARTHI